MLIHEVLKHDFLITYLSLAQINGHVSASKQHNFGRKGDLSSWQGYGSELAEVANLSDNVSLES